MSANCRFQSLTSPPFYWGILPQVQTASLTRYPFTSDFHGAVCWRGLRPFRRDFQSISRNPLGSPDIIGFTSGAATGALLQIILFSGSGLTVAFSAIAGGVMTAIAVYLLSVKSGTVGRYRLVLTGIGVVQC